MNTMDAVRRDVGENARGLGRWMGLRGLLTIAFGVLCLARPGSGVGILLGVFAAYCFLDGIALLAAAIGGAAPSGRGWLAFEGVVSIAAGTLALVMPGQTAVMLLWIVAVRALVVGASEIIAALRFGHAIPNPWLVALNGLLSMFFGILLLRNPGAGILSMAWLVGVYAIVVGLAELFAAGALRRAGRETPPIGATPVRG